MTAAGAAVVAHARSIGATELCAGVVHGNEPSIGVLTRLGFRHVEDLPGRSRRWLPLVDTGQAPVLAGG